MSDLVTILDLHDRLVATCAGLIPGPVLEAEAEVGRAARRRLGYLAESVVVALVGGTGSGKSSLLNAIAGEEVSPAGAVRPTTADPIAWIPANPEPGLVRLLDDLGIDRRVGHGRPERLAVLDLPDTDSVVPEHRRTVERLVPLVDAVVWVVDPEKYKDDRLHRGLLRPLARHSSRFLFALNQVDRLDEVGVDTLMADLRTALEHDGIVDPVIVPTAGDPSFGPPRGIEELLSAVDALGDAGEVVTRRVVTQLAESGDRLVESFGHVGGTDFLSRWTEARNQTARLVAEAVDTGLREAATVAVRADAAAVTSLIPGRTPTRVLDATGVRVGVAAAAPIRAVIVETGERLDAASRAHLFEAAPDVDHEVAGIANHLATATAVPLADPPRWWSKVRLATYSMIALGAVGVARVIDAARSNGRITPGVLLVVAGLVGVILLRRGIVRSARARIDRALASRRTADLASAELERRVGRPLRTMLRERSAPGAVHTELMLAISRFEET